LGGGKKGTYRKSKKKYKTLPEGDMTQQTGTLPGNFRGSKLESPQSVRKHLLLTRIRQHHEK